MKKEWNAVVKPWFLPEPHMLLGLESLFWLGWKVNQSHQTVAQKDFIAEQHNEAPKKAHKIFGKLFSQHKSFNKNKNGSNKVNSDITNTNKISH